MDELIALAKRRGFFYPGSELYGGLANTYDYGPVGTELLRNIKNIFWKTFVQQRSDIVGIDSSLISHRRIWEASGHVSGFADAMIDCKSCQSRYRADHLIEDYFEKKNEPKKVEGLSVEEFDKIIHEHKDLTCPKCRKHEWTNAKKFNQLFPVQLGIVVGEQSLAYLRGETAQGMFVAFKNVLDSTRVKLPFGIAQIGKSFRNEITLGNSIFRTIEFEQAEIEYFFNPETTNWEELYETWKKQMHEFITQTLGVREENLRWRTHTDEERSFYSKRTEDLEYKFPFGYKELWGLAYRTDYDLSQHSKFSKQELFIIDPKTNKKVVPHVIEPAVGVTRILLMLLADAYTKDVDRVFLKLSPRIAPYKAAVFPLLANKENLVAKAREIYHNLKKDYMVAWDDRGNIGKRYASQDEIGTPYCITVDFQSLEDSTVTVRDRDTGKQDRVAIANLDSFLSERVN